MRRMSSLMNPTRRTARNCRCSSTVISRPIGILMFSLSPTPPSLDAFHSSFWSISRLLLSRRKLATGPKFNRILAQSPNGTKTAPDLPNGFYQIISRLKTFPTIQSKKPKGKIISGDGFHTLKIYLKNKTCQPYSIIPSTFTSYNILSCTRLYFKISFSLNQISISFSASSTLPEA